MGLAEKLGITKPGTEWVTTPILVNRLIRYTKRLKEQVDRLEQRVEELERRGEVK